MLEFWRSEPRRRCTGCGRSVLNPHLDLGCAKWCKFASECLGLLGPAGTAETLAQSLIEEMKAVFGEDRPRIRHALEVLDYAETILRHEPADPLVVKAAAILHDIGIQQAERKHGSAAGKYQQIEGPPIARKILSEFGVGAEQVDHLCRIVASHHTADDIDTAEFRILWDADRLANLPGECAGKTRPQLEKWLREAFRTETGRQLAARKLLGEEHEPPSPVTS